MKTIDTLIACYDGIYYYSGNEYQTYMHYRDYYMFSGLLRTGILMTGIFFGSLLVSRLNEKKHEV